MILNIDKSDSGGQPGSTVLPQTEKKRKVFPIHPLLFAAFPLLALVARNVEKIPIQQIFWPLAMAILGTGVGWLFFFFLTRHVRKAALAASIVVLLFFSYGHIVNLVPKGLHGIVLPVCLLAMAALLFVIARSRQSLYDTTSVLNLAAVVLLAPSCWTILTQIGTSSPSIYEGAAAKQSKQGDLLSGSQATVTVNRHLSTAPQDVPDVYYIILDAYGRADRLQTYYGYDNTPFLQALEARGFFIARHSEANYNQTPLCLASALSMNYLDPPRGQQLSPEALRIKVDDNAVINYLRKKDYHYIDIASGLEESRIKTADMVLNDAPDLSTLEGSMLDLTALGSMASHQKKRYDRHRKRLNGGFDNLAKAAALPYPKFVFAHILAPHPPFVFGPNGEAIDPGGPLTLADASELLKDMPKDEYRRRYIAQLEYVNKRALAAVDAILKQSKHQPIIIIQGDHGSRMNLDWESLERTDLREPFSNLNAYLVPNNVRRDLTDKITAVNSFRIILTDAFGAKDLPRLPDRNFYSTESHPYNFVDVTERLARIAGDSRRTRNASRTARKIGGKGAPLLR
ncbi:MAG: hypothetical protein JWL77_62 [Chthonomonadaceae bacterium]|nr:hypothetical protein [Chthonomonadaceae bacterium]